MYNARHVAVLVGSLRKGSCNRKLAHVLAELAPRTLRLEVVEISRLSLYDARLDNNPPAEWRVFRHQIRAADGVLFLAPDYSRGIPGVLKNALDIAAHPSGHNAWEGKPGGVVCVSTAGTSLAGASRRLNQALLVLDMPVMQRPEPRVEDYGGLFDPSGRLLHAATRRCLSGFINEFDNWVHAGYLH